MEFTPVKSNLLVVMMRWGSSDEQNVLSFFRVGSCIAASGTISRKENFIYHNSETACHYGADKSVQEISKKNYFEKIYSGPYPKLCRMPQV